MDLKEQFRIMIKIIQKLAKEIKNNFGTGMQDPGDMAHSVR